MGQSGGSLEPILVNRDEWPAVFRDQLTAPEVRVFKLGGMFLPVVGCGTDLEALGVAKHIPLVGFEWSFARQDEVS
jgi:hypothetical protein